MPTQTLTLPTGRALEFAEYGDPAGHPAVVFHGLIGSHHQASWIAEEASRRGLRLIAPNRPGVGRSGFVRRNAAVEAVADVVTLADGLGVGRFSVIGISGGTPYALACAHRLPDRVATATLLSGMGPTAMRGSLAGMDPRRRAFFVVGSRSRRAAAKAFGAARDRYREDPARFLRGLVRTWSRPDRALFDRPDVFALFLRDLEAVFDAPDGPAGLAQELALYRRYPFALESLPPTTGVTIWHGLDDTIVPPAMAWAMLRRLPNAEAHLIPGGHFVAVAVARDILDRLLRQVDATG
jgi:pimeloyl-ACP methyl ester carboxylesterase